MTVHIHTPSTRHQNQSGGTRQGTHDSLGARHLEVKIIKHVTGSSMHFIRYTGTI